MSNDYQYGFTFHIIFSAEDNGWGCSAYRFDTDEFVDLGVHGSKDSAVKFFRDRGLSFKIL
jgi:hypothetical protein